jgi:hypothetical protein
MSRLEDELRRALRREDPPDGFAERVLSRAISAPPKKKWWNLLLRTFERPKMRWASVLALGLLLLIGFRQYREWETRSKAELAGTQAVLALRIASSKLQAIKEKVLELNNSQPAEQPKDNGRSRFGSG